MVSCPPIFVKKTFYDVPVCLPLEGKAPPKEADEVSPPLHAAIPIARHCEPVRTLARQSVSPAGPTPPAARLSLSPRFPQRSARLPPCASLRASAHTGAAIRLPRRSAPSIPPPPPAPAARAPRRGRRAGSRRGLRAGCCRCCPPRRSASPARAAGCSAAARARRGASGSGRRC